MQRLQEFKYIYCNSCLFFYTNFLYLFPVTVNKNIPCNFEIENLKKKMKF